MRSGRSLRLLWKGEGVVTTQSAAHPPAGTGALTPERIASACFYLAGVVALSGVFGVLLGSVPEIQDRLGVIPRRTGTIVCRPACTSARSAWHSASW